MKNIIIGILVIILGGLIFFSCKKYKDGYYGPELGVAPDNFSASALTVSNSNPNFTSQTIFFGSTFNARVRWTVTLTGRTTGAIKVLTGLSSVLDASNAVWDGSTDTIKQFRQGEIVDAKFTALGWKSSLSTTVTIGNEKYRGFVLGTFENVVPSPYSSSDPSQGNFQDATLNWWFYSFETKDEYDLIKALNDPRAPQGNYALEIIGHDANRSYFIGQVGMGEPPLSASAFNFGPSTLEDFYFNFYVKGSGIGSNKDYKFVVQVFEDDNGDATIQYDNKEDKFTYPVSLNYDGWKLHSIKYSDFILDPACVVSSISKVQNQDKIHSIGFFFGANTSAGLSDTEKITVELDYLCITTNGPMIP